MANKHLEVDIEEFTGPDGDLWHKATVVYRTSPTETDRYGVKSENIALTEDWVVYVIGLLLSDISPDEYLLDSSQVYQELSDEFDGY